MINNKPFGMLLKIVIICSNVLIAFATFAQGERQFEPMEYDGLPYQLLVCNVKGAKKPSLVVFLHGGHARGNDNQTQIQGIPLYVTVGSQERTVDFLADFTSEIKNAGGTVVFDILSGCGHPEACSKAFTAKRLKWLFSQKKLQTNSRGIG